MTFTLNRPKIKICCISSLEEAFLAIKYGADAIGLVGKMPSGPGIISDELISLISREIPPPIATFLLTSERKASDIIAHHQKVQTNTIQIVDSLEVKEYDLIRQAIPAVKIVQVIHVLNEKQIDEALEIELPCDGLHYGGAEDEKGHVLHAKFMHAHRQHRRESRRHARNTDVIARPEQKGNESDNTGEEHGQ